MLFAEEAKQLGLPMPMAMPRWYDHRRHPRRAAGRRSAGREPARRELTITSGKAADRAVYVVGVQDDLVITGVGEANVDGLHGIAAGDEILIDNSVYLAFQTYHRHHVNPDFPVWDQFRVAGQPVYPRRPQHDRAALRCGKGRGRTTPAGSRAR